VKNKKVNALPFVDTSYVQPKWLTETKIMSLSWPGSHIE